MSGNGGILSLGSEEKISVHNGAAESLSTEIYKDSKTKFDKILYFQ
jgi:hypothetical protein